MKQDLNGVRTAQDLERKYDFNKLVNLEKNYELQKNGLNKIEKELSGFIEAVTENLEELQNQVDGNITTWFYSGVPTIDNYPTNNWLTEEEKNNHLGDLYYDKQTGYAYRFCLEESVYAWIKITDNDVTEALALANSAKDTADSKRRVFVIQPMPPYDCGDLWINDEELYRCQTSKSSDEAFEINDWIIATKYTDDTVANQVGQNLTILSGTVTEIRYDVNELSSSMVNTTEILNEQGNRIGIIEEKGTEISQTVDEFKLNIYSKKQIQDIAKGISDDGTIIESISNISGTFDKDGLTLEQSGADTKTNINTDGMIIYNKTSSTDEPLLEVNSTGVIAKNIRVSTYLNIGKHSRIEDYTDMDTAEEGTAVFWIGSDN